MKKALAITLAGLAILLSGCVLLPSAPVVTAPVGPNPLAPGIGSAQGRLEVYSRLSVRSDDQNQDSTDPVWNQRTDYYLSDARDSNWRQVYNAAGHYSDAPRTISLPAGQYLVEAQAAPGNWVRVPVTIQSGRVTRVHLDSHWAPPGFAGQDQIVRLPHGQAIGWRL
jgi:hypothetical protein